MHRTTRIAACTLVQLVALAAATRAENWPQWRGPSGTGVSTEAGLPVEWGPDKNIAWKTPLAGLGVSSPIVWGDRVFVTFQVGAGRLRPGSHPTLVQGPDAATSGERPLGGVRREGAGEKISFAVAAFSRANGKPLWENRLDAEGELPPTHQKNNLANSSAVTDGERVYAWFGTGQLVAVDLNGKQVWSRHLGRDYAPFLLNWGHASSPVLFNDVLILLCQHDDSSYVLAVDKRTGRDRWKVDREKGVFSYSTPLVIEAPSGPELIVNSSDGVNAYRPATGERLWHYPEQSRFPIPMPVYHNGVLYLSRGYRSSPYMAIRPGGRGDVSKTHVVWRVDTGAPYISSLVHHDGLIYMATELGIVTVIDAKTGERVWRERLGGLYSASPVAGDGKIYFLSETGETIVLRAGRTPEVMARNDLGEQCIASPAISNGQLFIRTDRHLIAIRR